MSPDLQAHLDAIDRAIGETTPGAIPWLLAALSGMVAKAATRILAGHDHSASPSHSPDATLSVEEAARLLRVQRRTLMTWARRGEVPHLVLKWGKDGRAAVVRFSADSLRRWMASKEEK